MNLKQGLGVLSRYLILVLLALPNLFLFYFIFTPLTIYPVFIALKSFGAVMLSQSLINLNGVLIELIPACIAGAAYYFLLVLNLTTPMPSNKRVKSIIFLFASFLVLNVIRILLFTWLLLSGFQYFNLAHKATWYFGSTLLLIIIWFANVYLFKIKEIPVYSDFMALFKETRVKRKKRLAKKKKRL